MPPLKAGCGESGEGLNLHEATQQASTYGVHSRDKHRPVPGLVGWKPADLQGNDIISGCEGPQGELRGGGGLPDKGGPCLGPRR